MLIIETLDFTEHSEVKTGKSGTRFRVSPVMTASISLRIILYPHNILTLIFVFVKRFKKILRELKRFYF